VQVVRDERVSTEINSVHAENYRVYGIRKVRAQLRREDLVVADRPAARCTVARLMKSARLRGASQTKGSRTTVAATGVDTRPDLGDRQFTAAAPDRLWVADIPSCRTFAGWVYCAYVLDVFSRCVLGWHCSTSLRTELALYTLEFGL